MNWILIPIFIVLTHNQVAEANFVSSSKYEVDPGEAPLTYILKTDGDTTIGGGGGGNTIIWQPIVVPGNTYCTPYDDAQTPILGLLQSTKNECLVAGYTINNPVVVDCLIELKNRGVDVEIITDTTQAAGKHEVQAIAKLRRHSIPVFIGRSRDHQLMHAKFIVSDGESSEDGSYNYTVQANHQDNIIHINHDKNLAGQLRKYWFQIKEDLQ